jgi:hypothetical protein
MSARFSERDLDRWVEQGTITAGQREAILAELETHPPDAGLNLTMLLYYGGGLLVLLAYSVFLGFQWEAMNEAGRIVIAGLSLIFFGGVSYVLIRSDDYRLPGELLQVVAVAVVPLLAFAVLDAVGLWPEEPSFRRAFSEREEYQRDLTWARMGVVSAALLAAVVAFRASRSPFVMAAALVSLTAFFIDVSIQIEIDWETPQLLVIAFMGSAALAAGVFAPLIFGEGDEERDYALWLYVLGLVGLAVGLSSQTFGTEAVGWGILWLVVSLAIVALSLPLQQRLFAAAGLAGVFAYLAKLVFDVFESANAALILVVLGLLVLGMGMLYQRFNERLFPQGDGQ